MINNKGQSLVLFILILPILLGIMVLVIDVGNVLNKKNEMENKIEFVINYGLEEDINMDKLEMLVNYNLSDCKNKIRFVDDKIFVSSTTYVEGIFSNILDINGFSIVSNYEGYLVGNDIKIKKIK